MIKAAVITLSDKGSKGDRIDRSGQLIKEMLEKIEIKVSYYKILPDEMDLIVEELTNLCNHNYDLVITTGGTGVSPRDVTPEATMKVIEKRLYGFEIAMMVESLKKTPYAMISRAVAGVKDKTLIINLPGSPSAVEDNLKVILPALKHTIEKLKGSMTDCADMVKGHENGAA